jgi:hypothetical protein
MYKIGENSNDRAFTNSNLLFFYIMKFISICKLQVLFSQWFDRVMIFLVGLNSYVIVFIVEPN